MSEEVRNRARADQSSDDSSEIRLDPFFLALVGAYIKIAAFIKRLQGYTKTATYKTTMGVACSIASVSMCFSCKDLRSSMERNDKQQATLKRIQEFQVHKAFINDPALFWGSSRKRLDDHYGILLSFLDKQLDHVTVQHAEADVFLFHCPPTSAQYRVFLFEMKSP